MENEHENNGDGNTESFQHSSLPNISSPTRHEPTTSVQNAQPCVIINLTETESDIEDEVTFVSHQLYIPIIDISTPPATPANKIPASCLPSNSNGLQHPDVRFNFALNVSEVEQPDTSDKVPNCNICLNSMQKPHSTLCGHIFCQRCITNAIKTAKKCPYCGKKVNMSRIHPIYF